jgi:hypothetical protein
MAGKMLNINVFIPLKLRSGLTGKYHAICHYSYNSPLCAMLKKRQTVHKLNEITNRKSQRTFGTFASSDTHADASACKRAKFLPTLNRHY